MKKNSIAIIIGLLLFAAPTAALAGWEGRANTAALLNGAAYIANQRLYHYPVYGGYPYPGGYGSGGYGLGSPFVTPRYSTVTTCYCTTRSAFSTYQPYSMSYGYPYGQSNFGGYGYPYSNYNNYGYSGYNNFDYGAMSNIYNWGYGSLMSPIYNYSNYANPNFYANYSNRQDYNTSISPVISTPYTDVSYNGTTY